MAKLDPLFKTYLKAPNTVAFEFYGVDDTRFKLGDRVFEALKNESDGYRSYLGSIEVHDSGARFFPTTLGTVRVVPLKDARIPGVIGDRDDAPFQGFALEDVEDGHLWLIVGTRYGDSYYPSFTFLYQPKGAGVITRAGRSGPVAPTETEDEED